MFPKMTKHTQRGSLLGILCVPLLAGGIYLYYQHTAETVQERIYEVPERREAQNVDIVMTLPLSVK